VPSGWLSEAYEAVVAASEDEPRVYHVLTFFDSDMDTDDAELLEGVQGWNFRFQVIDMNAELGVTKRERKRSVIESRAPQRPNGGGLANLRR